MDGADFKPDKPHSLTLASCIGASWVFGGHARTLDALVGMAEPDGWVIVGESYWLRQPSDEHLRACGLTRDAFGSRAENVAAGEQRGLDLVHTLVSSKEMGSIRRSSVACDGGVRAPDEMTLIFQNCLRRGQGEISLLEVGQRRLGLGDLRIQMSTRSAY